MISAQEAKEKASAGWFDAWIAFEGLAVDSDAIKVALEKLVNQLDSDPKIKIYEKKFLEPKRVEHPIKGVKEAWSQVANLRIVVKSFRELAELVIEYGPSAVEIVGPSKSNLQMGEAQDILNNIGGMMHRFADAGIGGTVVVRSK